MIEHPSEQARERKLGPVLALIVAIATVPLVAPLLAFARRIGVIDFMPAGFIFVIYWLAIKGMEPDEFAPALLGSLGGLGMGYLLHSLPAAFGVTGSALAGAATCLALYLLIRRQLSLLINNAFMLLLILGTSLSFKAKTDFVAGAISIVITAIYAGALVAFVRTLGPKLISVRSKAPADVSSG